MNPKCQVFLKTGVAHFTNITIHKRQEDKKNQKCLQKFDNSHKLLIVKLQSAKTFKDGYFFVGNILGWLKKLITDHGSNIYQDTPGFSMHCTVQISNLISRKNKVIINNKFYNCLKKCEVVWKLLRFWYFLYASYYKRVTTIPSKKAGSFYNHHKVYFFSDTKILWQSVFFFIRRKRSLL